MRTAEVAANTYMAKKSIPIDAASGNQTKVRDSRCARMAAFMRSPVRNHTHPSKTQKRTAATTARPHGGNRRVAAWNAKNEIYEGMKATSPKSIAVRTSVPPRSRSEFIDIGLSSAAPNACITRKLWCGKMTWRHGIICRVDALVMCMFLFTYRCNKLRQNCLTIPKNGPTIAR